MLFVLIVVVAAVMTVSGQSAQPQPQAPAQAPVFRTAMSAVSVWATVRDSQGRFVPHLSKHDFELRVGGRPTEIAVFSNDEQPITVCLLIDMSGSVNRRFLRMREGAIQFVRALEDDDRARIGTFGAEIAISPVLTGDRAVLEQILREELWPGGYTPLWGAMGAALESLRDEPGRRVLVTMTDGLAGGTLPGYRATPGEVGRLLNDPGLIVYAIGIKDNLVMRPVLEADLVAMALASGGASFELADDADLEATFTRVAEELRSQYLIGFVPEAGVRGSQRISIRVKGADRAMAMGVPVSVVFVGAVGRMAQQGDVLAVLRPDRPLEQLAQATGGAFVNRSALQRREWDGGPGGEPLRRAAVSLTSAYLLEIAVPPQSGFQRVAVTTRDASHVVRVRMGMVVRQAAHDVNTHVLPRSPAGPTIQMSWRRRTSSRFGSLRGKRRPSGGKRLAPAWTCRRTS